MEPGMTLGVAVAASRLDIAFTVSAAGRGVAYISDDAAVNQPVVLTLVNSSGAELVLKPASSGGTGARLVVSFTDLAVWPHGALTADVPAGATSIPVTDVTGWAVAGDSYGLLRDGAQRELITVTAVKKDATGGALMLASPTASAYRAGTAIEGGVAALTVRSSEWDPVFTSDNGPCWTLTLVEPLIVPDGEGAPVMTIGNLMVQGRPRVSGLAIDYTLGHLAADSLTAPLPVTPPPAPAHRPLGPGDLLVDFTSYLNTVFVTPEGDPDAPCALQFTLTNGSMTDWLADEHAGSTTPLFYLFFNYGTGPGTLTRADVAAREIKLQWISGEDWDVEDPIEQMAVPFWTLKPKHPGVLKKRGSVTFRLTGIVSHFARQQREYRGESIPMYLVYTGLRGVQDGTLVRTVSKVQATPQILHFAGSPTQVNIGDEVHLSWQTVAIPKLRLTFLDEQDGEQGITLKDLNADAYGVSSTSTRGTTEYFLHGYCKDRDPITAFVAVVNVFPSIKALQAAPVHDGDTPVLELSVRHADAVTIAFVPPGQDPSTIVPDRKHGYTFVLPKTTLAAACDEGELTITVASADEFPASGRFGIQLEQEFVTVVAGQGTTTWTLERRAEAKPYARGAVVRLTTPRYTAPQVAHLDRSTYAVWAWSNDSVSAATAIEVPIRPRILYLFVKTDDRNPSPRPIVERGSEITLMWELDDVGTNHSQVSIDGIGDVTQKVPDMQWGARLERSTKITRATTFTLTSTVPARPPAAAQQDARQLRVGTCQRTVLLPDEQVGALFVPWVQQKLYVSVGSGTAIVVIDVKTLQVLKRLPMPPGYGVWGFGRYNPERANRFLAVVLQAPAPDTHGDVHANVLDVDLNTDEFVSQQPTTRMDVGFPSGRCWLNNGWNMDIQPWGSPWAMAPTAIAYGATGYVLFDFFDIHSRQPSLQAIQLEL